ncbi:MAG: hypothetical protein ACKO96_24905 [Flammeovirgaceae bacterium]
MNRLPIVFLFLNFFIAHAQKGVRESCDITTPPTIDGNVGEWTVDWNLDGESKILYNFCNDAENLYVRLKFTDDLTQRKIAMYGLYIKLDATGKKKGKIGLKYPIGKDDRELKKEKPVDLPDAAAVEAYKRQMLGDVEVVELIGLAKEGIVASRLGLANGIEVLITPDESANYVYEAKIPFKAFGIDKSKTPLLGITVETGRQTTTNQPASAAPPAQGFGQRGFSGGGGYSMLAVPAYMWIALKLR